MVYYKRLVCDRTEISKIFEELRTKYNRISIFLPGHPKHEKYGLAEDKVLIIAHKG